MFINNVFMFKKYKEKDWILEALVDENPYYFYDILPYAYVLGITNKYIKKFEGIALKNENFYSNDTLDFNQMSRLIDDNMYRINRIITARDFEYKPTENSGYSSSSYSGGGSGGGGGRSW